MSEVLMEIKDLRFEPPYEQYPAQGEWPYEEQTLVVESKEVKKASLAEKAQQLRVYLSIVGIIGMGTLGAIALNNPYLVGHFARQYAEQVKRGWEEQPGCFNGTPRRTDGGGWSCAPSGK